MSNPIHICVAGWYGFPECYDPLAKSGRVVNVVAHRECYTGGLPTVVIPNDGLEWGMYEFYRSNVWDRVSDVLFMHDDTHIADMSFVDDVQITSQVVMIWRDERHRQQNYGHGRAFAVSAAYLSANAFWYDSDNHGNLSSRLGANKGILDFYTKTKRITTHLYTAKIKMGSRGRVR